MNRQSFLIVAKEFLADNRISVTAKLLFALLEDHENKRTGQCNPRQSKLAQELGISQDTVQRGLSELREAGFIEMKRTRGACKYEIKKPQLAVSRNRNLRYLGSRILSEPYFKEPTARGRAVPSKRPIQSEVLARYYAQQRKAGR